MDNKNEKTFTDLFLNSKTDNDGNASNVNFDNLVSEIFEKDTEGISFNDIKIVDDVVNDLDIDLKVNIENDIDLKLAESENPLFENEKVEEAVESENPFFEKEEVAEEVVESENPFFEKEEVAEEVVESENPFFEKEEVSEEVVESENPFFEKEEVAEEVVESENLFFEKEGVAEEVVESENPFFEKEGVAEEVVESENPFFEKEEVAEEVVESENPFFEKEEVAEEVVESENPFFEKEEVVEENNSSLEPVSVSPFFEENNFANQEENLLGFDKISLDEGKNINSKLEKIDLSKSKHFNVKVVKKKEPLLKFIISVISYAFFIFLMLVLVALLVYVLDIKIRASKGDYSAPKINAYVVLTGSMLPDIKVKDVVVTKRVDTNDLEVGDIITFASSDSRYLGTIITHRIIKKNQDNDGNITFQTKGDNNNVADNALVYPNNIYGKVILKIPKLGYLQDFLATKGGWIIVILIPCLTVISYDIVKISKGLKRKKIKVLKK